MSFRSDYDVRKYPWEDKPSTRESTHLWTVYDRVNVTLATPGTAEDAYLISEGNPTINMITNPSIETDTSNWVASGATLAQSATQALYGTYSLRITPANAIAGEGAYFSLGQIPQRVPLGVSCYLYGSAGDARIRIYGSTSGWIADGNTISLGASWQRTLVHINSLPDLATGLSEEIRVYIVTVTQHGTLFYADGMQAEVGDEVSEYCDGAQGWNYKWDGTAHASVSRRFPGIAEIRGLTLHITRDAYVAYDRTASSTTGELIKAGTDWWEDYPVRVRTNISFINRYAGEQPHIYGRVWGIPKKLSSLP